MSNGTAEQRSAEVVAVDTWNEKNQQILVGEGQGFLYNLKLRAKVDGSPSIVYSILTDPNTINVFRSIKECTFRKVLEESPSKKQRKLEVAHRAVAKFLFISVSFETRLHVWEDDFERKIRFCNARDMGFMKKFEGSWHIQSFNSETTGDSTLQMLRPANPFAALQQSRRVPRLHNTGFGIQPAETSSALVTLEQAILPRGPMPPGMKGLVRRLCAKQINDMMEDLRAEVDRREGRTKENLKSKAELAASQKAGQATSAAAAASMTLSQPPLLWDAVAPFNITIHL